MKMHKSCQASSSANPLMRRLHNEYNNGLPSSELIMQSGVYPLIETYLRAYATQLSFVEAITTERQDDLLTIKFVFRSDKSDTEV
jgi:hypothetical protein